MAASILSNMVVRLRLMGWLHYVEPWKLPLPALGETVIVDTADPSHLVVELTAPKGPPVVHALPVS